MSLHLEGKRREALAELNLAVEAGEETAEVLDADELLLSSATKEVLAIVTLDGRPIGGGRPGPIFADMYAWYQEFKQTVMRRG